MSDNVVSLRGAVAVSAPTPNVTLISELERLLDSARAGEIVGMAGSYVQKDKVVTYSYAGAVAGYSLLGGLECVRQRLVQLALAHD